MQHDKTTDPRTLEIYRKLMQWMEGTLQVSGPVLSITVLDRAERTVPLKPDAPEMAGMRWCRQGRVND